MKSLPLFYPLALAVVLAACAASPELAYESAPEQQNQSSVVDSGEARALEQAEADCRRQGKHAESQRVEGETVYHCAPN